MKKDNVLTPIVFLMTLAFGLAACSKKANTINNGTVIETPFSLYFGDSSGAIYNSTDGKNFKVIFPSDGRPTRALGVINNNLFYVKSTMFMSENNGKNFNSNFIFTPSYHTQSVYPEYWFDLNQSMFISLPSWNQAYVASNDPSSQNYFGIAGNQMQGLPQYWLPEHDYSVGEVTHTSSSSVTSFTALKNGVLVGFDAVHMYAFTRAAANSSWKETNPVTGLSATPSWYSIGHLNNRLFAIDNYGASGIFASDDMGANWFPVGGAPASVPYTCVCTPFEEICLVGSYKQGVYVFNPNTGTFAQSNNGLHNNAIVRNITFKQNVFKNGTVDKVIFAATDKGIYESRNNGANWVKTIPGNFYTIY